MIPETDHLQRRIDQHLEQAEKLIWFAIEQGVKAVLQDPNNPATGFISAMGGWGWLSGYGEPKDRDYLDDNKYHWQAPIDAIYDKYNETFKMYGAGVRWDLVDGKVIKSTNW